MNLLVNFIVGIVLSVIDLYIIFLYKNNVKVKAIPIHNCRLKLIFYIISSTMIIISNCFTAIYPIKFIFIMMSTMLIFISHYKINFEIIKLCIVFSIIRIFINTTILIIFSWILDTSLSATYPHHFVSYVVLIQLMERYITFTIFLTKRMKTNFHIFKTVTILLFAYLGIVIIKDLKSLFYFPDIGRTFVFVIFISIASLIFFDRYQVKHEKIERDLIITTQNITKEKEYLKKYNDSADEIRKMRHNMHNDLNIIYGYLNSNEFDDAMKHVCHLLGDMNKTSAIIHVGHTSIDSIIDDKIKVMAAKDITYTEEIVSVNIGNIDVNTIAILVGLALDNAIEAAEKVDSGREVKLEIMNRKNYLVLHIENSIIPGSHPTFNKTSKLTDPMNHGYGVKQINHIAKQYNGNAKFEVNHNFVTLKIILDMRLNEDPSL